MKSGFWVLLLTIIILSTSVWDQVFVQNTLATMNERCVNIYTAVKNDEPTQEIIDLVNDTSKYWRKKEKKLCLLVSHKDMSSIANSLDLLYTSLYNEDSKAVFTHAYLLRDNMQYLGNMISFNIENIF